MIVPVLTLWLDTPFRRAVATSLVIICLTGLAALASHLLTGAKPDVATTVILACSTGLGALAGTHVGERLPQALLRRGFAVIVTAVAVGLLWTCSCSAGLRRKARRLRAGCQRHAVHAPGEQREETERERQHGAVGRRPQPARDIGLALALEQR